MRNNIPSGKKKIEEKSDMIVADAIVEFETHDCLTIRQFALLASRTHASDFAMDYEPRSVEQMGQEVNINAAKFCIVNSTVVTEMESWLRTSKTTDFLVNCEDGVTNE